MGKEILVITSCESTKEIFHTNFHDKYNVSIHSCEKQAIEENKKSFFSYIFIDLFYIKHDQRSPLTEEEFNERFIPLLRQFPKAKKIIMADRRSVQDCILSVKLGIDSYVTYPLIVEEIQYVMNLIYEQIKNQAVIKHLEQSQMIPSTKFLLESVSKSMKAIIEKVKAVSKTESIVLITGESGTGKTVMARRIHNRSKRKKQKFISVQCSALPENLIESELFGHEKGSFTGAIKKKIGKFELANGGTIFLDEIGTLTESTQIKLLQVLQERFIQRVGGESDIEVDIRVIAATNSDLKDLVSKKTFREDLYYRLNVFQIEMPPLRKRTEDIIKISMRILNGFNTQYGKSISKLDDAVTEAFLHYSWPGNIRELANLIERAFILEKSDILTAQNFPSIIFKETVIPQVLTKTFTSLNLHTARAKVLDDFEQNYMKQLLKESKGELKEAALISGVTVRQLHKLIAKHHINRKSFTIE